MLTWIINSAFKFNQVECKKRLGKGYVKSTVTNI